MKSWLSDDEIAALYRDAKDKNEQIRIIAQLTLLTTYAVKKILHEKGLIEYEPPPTTSQRKKRVVIPWTDADVRRLVFVVPICESWKEVALHFPTRKVSSIAHFALNHGLSLGEDREFIGKTRRNKWTPGKRDLAFDMARNGATWQEIADTFNVTTVAARSMFQAARKRGDEVPDVKDTRGRKPNDK